MNLNYRKKLKETLKDLNFVDNDIHSKRTVICDKICPKCNTYIYGNNDFCKCGFSVIREKAVKLWGIILFTWFFIIAFIFFIFNSFSELNSVIYKKLESNHSDYYSLSPVNIQIITSLRNSKYRDYIQTVFIDPKEKNKLIVLIKPVYREMLSFKEKEQLKQIVMKKWSEIYQNTPGDSKLKPVVSLAD